MSIFFRDIKDSCGRAMWNVISSRLGGFVFRLWK